MCLGFGGVMGEFRRFGFEILARSMRFCFIRLVDSTLIVNV